MLYIVVTVFKYQRSDIIISVFYLSTDVSTILSFSIDYFTYLILSFY